MRRAATRGEIWNHRPTGRRRTTTKFSLYTVHDGAIVREEVYYLDR